MLIDGSKTCTQYLVPDLRAAARPKPSIVREMGGVCIEVLEQSVSEGILNIVDLIRGYIVQRQFHIDLSKEPS